MHIADEQLLSTARQLKLEIIARMFGFNAQAAENQNKAATSVFPAGSNIVGVGFGAKVTSGSSVQDELAVRVYVRAKLPKSSLAATEAVPSTVNGVPTDVVPVGDLKALGRPTACGVSVGHLKITAGTLGCLVKRSGDGSDERYILSNNHVLANSNDANNGDFILEPGVTDGGIATNPIAKLTDFEPMRMSGEPNMIDAAIAKIINNNDVTPNILDIGNIQSPIMPAALYQSVRKRGRTTLHTVGIIMDLSADINVRYGSEIAHFEDQIAINGINGMFSDGGDSGSLIVDAVTKRPVALLFAGGGNTTFGNPIGLVLSRFNVEII
ncbi:hypothetical protein [Merismopedia glauca]|uniref:Peptidase S1 domain-containing protein n=1 Tax=Merismopedia glauca CCAP 1448/3 TaxID=1296344 RepID=A0A2T1C8Y9_9CYAN|nr:hypothetical protein [Merismopedia glauca]PSB04603.1 hypothetical protein C7B64_03370 [Merismopedia glauca CCAP 1448/3]